MSKGKLVAMSAPSGAGKSTICQALTKSHDDFIISISATTRAPREYEVDGQHYYFLSDSDFKQRIANGDMLEYEEVHGNYYGTPRQAVEAALAKGKTVLFDVDVLGALTIKHAFPEAILIYIKAPSLEILEERLRNRQSESEAQIEKRMQRIRMEESKAEQFDHIVVNDDLDAAIQKVEAIIMSEEPNANSHT